MTDLRRHHRVGVALAMNVRGLDCNGKPFEEKTSSSDLSRGGCSFQCSCDVAPGAELELEILRNFAGSRLVPFLTTGLVLRTEKLDSGGYIIGVRFTGPQFPTFSRETASGA